eukprot:SAG11_NODE_6018_length_1408_cov_1.747899_1_plen_114_part_01
MMLAALLASLSLAHDVLAAKGLQQQLTTANPSPNVSPWLNQCFGRIMTAATDDAAAAAPVAVQGGGGGACKSDTICSLLGACNGGCSRRRTGPHCNAWKRRFCDAPAIPPHLRA